jgi:starch synthase
MRILHVASELFPLVKTGGLADVLGALPQALVRRGLDVRVLLPGFPGVIDGVADLQPVTRIGPVFGAASVTLYAGRLPGSNLTAYVIDAPFFFRRDGNPYVDPDGQDWNDNHRRFGLLGWTGAHLASGELDLKWMPDVVHAHDWHAGLTPAYITQNPALKTPTVFTIHNLAFRGIFPLECHYDLDLPMRKMTPHGIEFHGNFSFMKAGLVYSNKITTVSPSYAREICTQEFGCGLDGVMRDREWDLSGILNGVDYTVWNPGDVKINKPYSADDLTGKKVCKKALQLEFGLSTEARGPLFAVVSRLTSQKGMDLLLAALPELLQDGGQLIVLGSGEGELEAGFRYAASANPENVAVYIGYSESMSHRFMAGADILLVPSRFEPCGLTQLYALRYGTLPLVRRVGGLADTVVDVNDENLATDRATGFVFVEAARHALGARIREACEFYRNNVTAWTEVQRRAMRQNFSWDDSAANYEQLYKNLVAAPSANRS